jgi:hypothetical protein
VTFSYPRQEPFGSSSLVYGGESHLTDFTDEELIAALDAILRLRKRFTVLNPAASIRDVQRHLRGEPERFACVGGFKYFYMDWRLDIWRCEAWGEPMGSVFDLDRCPDDRSPCAACIMSCYRNASVLMHAGIAAADAAQALSKARPLEAARTVFTSPVAQSLGAVLQDAALMTNLGFRSGAAVPSKEGERPDRRRPQDDRGRRLSVGSP